MPGKIKFIYGGKEKTMEIISGYTVLDLALQADINPPYSCMEGVCQTCQARLDHGKVVDALGQAVSVEQSSNLVLTCQVMPEKNQEFLIVNYDFA